MSWTEDEARALAERILSFSRADECDLTIEAEDSAHTRFAANDVTTSGVSENLTISIASRGKGKSGTVRISETDPDSLKRAVARSEELMELAPVDPEYVEGLGPQTYATIAAYHEATARAGPAERRDGVRAALDAGRSNALQASGYFETETRWSAIAGKRGLFAFHRATAASYSTTLRTEDGTGSGWAGFGSPRVGEIHAGELVDRAARKAEGSAKPRELEPGRYTVILEPAALADFLGTFGFSLSARAADEGRSYFSETGGGSRIGQKIFADGVTLSSDPTDPRIPGRPWTGGGTGGGFQGAAGNVWALPARPVTWIEKGVLKNLSLDRYWAAKTKREPLPYPGSLVMEGGTGSVEELIAGAERALLVTRFWYIRTVNPQTLQLTGLTRDGLWLVEGGKIVGPVNNFRFNESTGNALKNVEAMSAAVSTGSMVLPAIRIRDFNFSSKSDAV